MKAVVAAFDQEKALVGAFSVITNFLMELFQALVLSLAARGSNYRHGRLRLVTAPSLILLQCYQLSSVNRHHASYTNKPMSDISIAEQPLHCTLCIVCGIQVSLLHGWVMGI